jgi:hypothetical protein
VHGLPEVLVKSMTWSTPPAYPWATPSFTRSELVGQDGAPVAEDRGVEFEALPGAAGAVVVTVVVVVGVADWLPEDAQPATVAT